MHSRKPPLQEVKAPPFVESPNEVRVLTFNLGLLRITAAGVELKGAPPHVSERFAYIPAAIAAVGADIIFLQEIYEPDHVARLRAALPQYPHFARRDNQRFWQFHNGLLVLSKFPIDFWVLKKHKECSALERNFACKSCLATYITTPAGKLCFVNMHTTAGGGVDPESDGVDAGREAELAEAMAMCAEAAKEGYAGAVVGDLNMGPEASKPNYDYMGAQARAPPRVRRAERSPR
jgi:endonuclease/exonuclease/phosphatase family metal-dependent hydrolase